jgi:methylthioribose-1-phosphate isomerase
MVDISQGVQTLRWRNGVLEMIDQRVLPSRFEYLRYESAASVAEGIHTMVVRGAPAIGVAAAYGVALEAIRLKGLQLQEFDYSLHINNLNGGFKNHD